MNDEALRSRVLADDWDAPDVAQDMGVAALPVLVDLWKNPKPEIRTLVLGCLRRVPDAKAVRQIAMALDDPDSSVRDYAAEALQETDNRGIRDVLVIALTHRDAAVRRAVALLLGRLDDRSSVDAFQARLKDEKDDDVVQALRMALARLGDRESRASIVAGLRDRNPRRRYEILQDLRYVRDLSVAADLVPLLGDREPAFNAGSKHAPRDGRICDAVVSLASELFGKPFEFPTYATKIYSDDEIESARTYLTKKSVSYTVDPKL